MGKDTPFFKIEGEIAVETRVSIHTHFQFSLFRIFKLHFPGIFQHLSYVKEDKKTLTAYDIKNIVFDF